MMRLFRSALLTLSVLLGAAFVAVPASANQLTDVCKGQGANSVYCQDLRRNESQNNNSFYGPNGILIRITNIIAIIAGIAAVIVLTIAGIRYILAGGESAKVNEAKNAIIYALVGLVITILARSIIVFVINRL